MNRARSQRPRFRALPIARVLAFAIAALAAGLAIVIGYDRLHPVAMSPPTAGPKSVSKATSSNGVPRPTPARSQALSGSGTTISPAESTTSAPSAARSWEVRGAPAEVAASFAEATRGLGEVGVAYAVAGRGGVILMLGTWRTGPAWSTAKVPVAIAAGRHPTDDTQQFIQAALTRSDNAAAEALWAQLGGGERAASLVDAQLRRLGDSETRIQASRVRPPFTPFGQTTWSLDAQVRVAARLSCSRDPVDRSILDAMGQVVAEQHWGLGRFAGSAVKGGWGPNPAGQYLVRQFGVINVEGNTLAVAMAVEPTDGSFASGTAVLDVMSAWLVQSGASETLNGSAC